MSFYYTLGNLLTLCINITHFSFYFRLRKPAWLALPIGLILLMFSFLLPTFHQGNLTDWHWPLQVILYAFYCSLVFKFVMFEGSYSRILSGVFFVASFGCVNQIVNHAFFLHILDWPSEAYTFWTIRIGQFVFCLVALPLLYIFARQKLRLIFDSVARQGWPDVVLPPMFVYMVGYLTIGTAFTYHSYLTFLLSLATVGVIVVYYTSAYLRIVQRDRNRFLSDMIESFNKLLPYYELYNVELDKKERALRTMRHDLRHVLGGLTLAAREGDMEGLLSVVEQISAIDTSVHIQPYADNKAINGVISFYFSVATQKGVKCSAQIHIPDSLGVPQPELVLLFGNALENCVKAASPLGEKGHIAVSSKVFKDCLVFKTVNNFMHGYHHHGEGLGLDSIRMLCERHQGRLDLKAIDNDFHLTAILKIPPGEHK